MIDTTLFWQSLPLLARGAVVTLQIASLSCLIGFILGTILALIQQYTNSFGKLLVTVYTTIIRGTPMLIQILFAVYVLPQLIVTVSPFWACVIAIGLNSSAYISQIIRTGILSVNKGQLEAARVLGLSRLQTIRYIVLPQAIRVVIPALGNELITLTKDSSLASTVGVLELTKEGSLIISRTFDAITIYTAVALIYLTITSLLSLATLYLEKRMQIHARH